MSRPAPDFGFGSDEEMLRDLARRFLDEHLPVERLRTLVAGDHQAAYERGERPAWDEGLWKQIVELGWPGVAVPEDCGGIGGKLVAVAGIVEEVGRHALPSPFVATLGATYALRAAESDAANAWLARVADGTPLSLAITDERGSWDPGSTGVSAEASGDGLTLTGTACFVQDAFKADAFVVSAQRGDGIVLCVVPRDTTGVELSQDHIHDLTRDQATVSFRDVQVPAEHVVCEDGAAALRRAWPALLVIIAADLCGCAEWQLQTTVAYAKDRKQFDRPLGFFQAVKHPIVNTMIAIDQARSLLYHAACCYDEGESDAENAARMAKSAASDAGAFVSDRSVQLHGGIGFTWECDVHLYFKRSMHDQALFGDGVHQRKALADAIVGPIGG